MCNGSWEATFLFKSRTVYSPKVNEKQKKWGRENDECEKCGKLGERQNKTLEHLFIAC